MAKKDLFYNIVFEIDEDADEKEADELIEKCMKNFLESKEFKIGLVEKDDLTSDELAKMKDVRVKVSRIKEEE